MKTRVRTFLVALLLAFPLTATAQWVPATSMPEPRYGAASAVYGGKLYIFGGVDADQNVRRETFAYDPWRQVWETNHAHLPVPRRQAAAVVFQDRIYVIGGSNGSAPSDSVFVYRPDIETWGLAGRLLTPREGCAAVVWRDNIYVLAGISGFTAEGARYLSDVEIFDTVVGRGVEVSISLPDPPRANLTAASFMGKLYVIGGLYFGPVSLVDVLDQSGQWKRLAGLQVPRAFAAAVVTPQALYVIGGEGFAGPLRSVEILSAATPEGSFLYADSLLAARAEFAAGHLAGRLFAAGGRGPNTTLKSVETMLTEATTVRSGWAGTHPVRFELDGPYPNPFSRSTQIRVAAPSHSLPPGSAVVYDCLGRVVRRLSVKSADGQASVVWDGKNENGLSVPPGVYVVRVRLGSRTFSRKVVYVR